MLPLLPPGAALFSGTLQPGHTGCPLRSCVCALAGRTAHFFSRSQGFFTLHTNCARVWKAYIQNAALFFDSTPGISHHTPGFAPIPPYNYKFLVLQNL